MLTELITTIETLKERIKEHRPYYDAGKPEARTRVSLIDPLLVALGWDVGDPALVEIEPMVAKGQADYALLGQSREPLVLLEAKRLSDTRSHHGQLATYVVGENLKRRVKIPYCAITNGSRWQVFDVFSQDCVVDASVEGDSARRCALRLLGLWQPTLREASIVEQAVDLGRRSVRGVQLGETSATAVRGPVPIETTSRTERPTDGLGTNSNWTPLDSDTVSPSGSVWPSEIRFPDGNISKVESWTSMLVAIAKWLFDARLLTLEEMPFVVAGTRYCVSADGRRPDGKRLGRPLSVGEAGFQIEGDFTAKQIRRFAVDLLRRYKQASSEVGLKLVS
ncbi:MAG: hypothetical protein OXH09_03435 [Gammaproteobacteria bacterium]|nr:hypothetical protein [Gammaproteobacteria bacterium]